MTEPRRTLDLGLRYTHGAGALGKLLESLSQGRATAAQCAGCQRIWFPPHVTCPEDGSDCRPIELAGTGVVVGVTQATAPVPFAEPAQERTFVLVAMDGSDTAAFGRLLDHPAETALGLRVRLALQDSPVAHPAQALVFRKEAG